LPDDPTDAERMRTGAVEGMYRFADAPAGMTHQATILFSGVAHTAARAAATELATHYNVGAELWSVTSYKRLREQAQGVLRRNRLHPSRAAEVPTVTERLASTQGPVTAVTDFMCSVPDQICRFVPDGRAFHVLGTDGMGRSDTREALRRHFEVDCGHVVVATLTGLMDAGHVGADMVADAINRYGIDPEANDPFAV